MSEPTFTGQFTQQEALPEEAIERAVEIMRGGRLHRYNVLEGEESETTLLESDFAASVGSKYCLACTSGGYAMHVALRAWGLKQDEPVLTNAFTLSPVPGAIHNAGGKPVLVETTNDLVIDLDDLGKKIKSSGSRVLLLSHMRGHIVNMDKLCQILNDNDVTLVEDCAHTMGAYWDGKPSGSFGHIACYSTQTYKHINSGEGGFLTTDDDQVIANAIILSGSYMLYDRHDAAPSKEAFEQARYQMPNMSGRMDNLRAAILRPQLARLETNGTRWNELYDALAEELKGHNGITQPQRRKKERYVGSSLQFFVPDFSAADCVDFVRRCSERGVELKWFGAEEPAGYTSTYQSWGYIDDQSLPKSDKIMSTLFDLRLPLTFNVDDCKLIGQIIGSIRSDMN